MSNNKAPRKRDGDDAGENHHSERRDSELITRADVEALRAEFRADIESATGPIASKIEALASRVEALEPAGKLAAKLLAGIESFRGRAVRWLFSRGTAVGAGYGLVQAPDWIKSLIGG